MFRITRGDLAHPDKFFAIQTMVKPDDPTYIIQEEDCLLQLFTTEIIKEFLEPFLPGREEIVKQYEESIQNLYDHRMNLNLELLHQFFTRGSLLYFAQTGRFHRLPVKFCKPLSIESRIYLLKEFQKYCKTGMFRMLRTPLEHLSCNLRLVVSGDIVYLTLCNDNSPFINIFFNESVFLDIFRDYMESLEEFCYSTEDTLDCVQEIIDSL